MEIARHGLQHLDSDGIAMSICIRVGNDFQVDVNTDDACLVNPNEFQTAKTNTKSNKNMHKLKGARYLRSICAVLNKVFYKFYLPYGKVELRHDMQLMDQHFERYIIDIFGSKPMKLAPIKKKMIVKKRLLSSAPSIIKSRTMLRTSKRNVIVKKRKIIISKE